MMPNNYHYFLRITWYNADTHNTRTLTSIHNPTPMSISDVSTRAKSRT